jgi:hypothetical protein
MIGIRHCAQADDQLVGGIAIARQRRTDLHDVILTGQNFARHLIITFVAAIVEFADEIFLRRAEKR